MPITVKQAIPGVLGRLAVRAGEARGRELQMGRDIQLTSLALAAQDRAAQIGMAARDRSFALQRAGAAQIARQRPVTPDTRAQQRRLNQFVVDAKASNLYSSEQLKRMKLLATLGDEKGVLGLAGQVSKPTLRRRELESQEAAVTKIGRSDISELRGQLNEIEMPFSEGFFSRMQETLQERPEIRKSLSPDMQKKLDLQQQLMEQKQLLEGQIEAVRGRTERTVRGLQMGISTAEQMAFEARQEAELGRQETARQKQILGQVGKLSEQEELAIDVFRDRERDVRRDADREITRLSRDLAPLEGEGPEETILRNAPTNVEIRRHELDKIASFAKEKKQIEGFLKSRQRGANVPKVYTTPDGKKYEFTGRYVNGKPWYEPVE